MADDEAKVLSDAKQLPLSERVAHKNWKVRSDVYDDIKHSCQKVFSDADTVLNQYGSLFVKGVADTNAAALDKCLEALQVYLQKANESHAARIAAPVSAILATKVFKQRPGTVQRAKDVYLIFCELEQADTVVEAVIKVFTDKVPKVVVAAVDVVTSALSLFGVTVVSPQPLLKALPKLFEAKQEPVRDGAKNLVAELCCWTGPKLVQDTLLDKMPDSMRKDVEKLLEDIPTVRKRPERFTRKEEAQQAVSGAPAGPAVATAGASITAVAPEAEEGMDAYEYAEPAGILSELGKEFWEMLAAKKWSERRDALAKLRTLASAPKLASGDYGDVNRELKKIISKDSHIGVVSEAVACTGVLARGLRKEYSSSARVFVPVLLDKFKDKNTICVNNVSEALSFMHMYCLTMADIQDDLVSALEHKNPKVKVETLKLIEGFVGSASKPNAAKVHSSVLSAAAKSASEAAPDIREAALAVLVAFGLKAGSVSVLNKVTDKLDDSRKKKLEDMVQKATTGGPPSRGPASAVASPRRSPASSPGSSRPSSARGTADAGPKALGIRNTNAPVGKPPAAATKASVAKRGAAGPGGKVKGNTSAASITSGPADDDDAGLAAGTLSKAEAEEKMLGLFGEGILHGLQSSNWKERLTSMEALQQQVQDRKENLEGTNSILIQGMSYVPGWSEKNFQVLGKVFELIALLATESSKLSKKDAFTAITGLVDKMSDIKLKGPAGEALTAMSEALGPQFIFTQLHKRAAAQKNPKVLSESINWMATAVEEFGLGTLDVKALIDNMKVDLASSNATIRNAAISLLTVAHKQLGPGLADMLRSDVKPALMTALEDAFKRNPQEQVMPSRKVRKAGQAGKPAGSYNGPIADEDDEPAAPFDPDALLPRIDISSQITSKLVANMGSANWKERNAALDEVEEIIKAAGGRIQPSVGDLMSALKGRMADTNRNLTAKTLLLLGELAKAMGSAFDSVGRPLLSVSVANLSDTKSQVRTAILSMLDAWVTVVPVEKVLPSVADAIAAPKASSEGKLTGLKWLATVLDHGRASKGLAAVLRSATLGMNDKASDVREAGTTLMTLMLEGYGPEAVSSAANVWDPSSRKTALEAVQKAGHSLPSASMSAATAMARSTTGKDPKPLAGATNKNSSRPSTAKARPAATIRPGASSAGLAASEGVCLQISNKKDERARKTRHNLKGGKFEGVRDDEAEGLEAELAPVVSDSLKKLLFSADFRRHIEAADLLLMQLPDVADAAVSCLDLLLRWAVLRLCDANTQCLLKVLDLCKALFDVCQEMGYQLSEYETMVFVPCLIEKAGHNQDRIRQLHRELLKQVRGLYNTPRLVDLLVQGLASKNNRTRVEAAEAIGEIVQDEGVHVVDKARHKPLPALAQIVSDRDKTTRAAALGTLELVYMSEGQAIWSMLGRLSDQQQSLLEERFKYTDKQATRNGVEVGAARADRLEAAHVEEAEPSLPTVEARADVNGASLRSSQGSFPVHPTPGRVQSMQFPASVLVEQAPAMNGFAASQASAQITPPIQAQTPMQPQRPAALSSAPTPMPASTPLPHVGGPLTPFPAPAEPRSDDDVAEQWSRGMAMLHDEDLAQSVEGMKVLCFELMEASGGRASASTLADLSASANELVVELTRRVHQVFDTAEQELAVSGQPSSSRGCKYALNTLMQTFQLKTMAANVAAGPLRECAAVLLMKLLDDKVPALLEGTQLLKALNVLMLKILDNCNRTYSFVALIVLLRCPPEQLQQQGQDILTKFSDLVVKCLIKLTKALQNTLDELDLEMLLMSIHDYFMGLGVDEIRRRGADDDKPLRMVKTILHELCKLKGLVIKEHMCDIPQNCDPAPIIRIYVDLNLQTLHKAGVISGTVPMPAGTPQEAALPPATSGVQVADRDASSSQGHMHSSGSPGSGQLPQAVQEDKAARTASAVDNPPLSPAGSLTSPGSQETKARLANIFKMIGDKGSTERGLVELWHFQQDHPETDINPHLARTSSQFRHYIQRGLSKVDRRMANSAGVGRSSSSPVPDDTDVPTASDSMSRGQSAGPDAHPVSVTSAETHTPSISPCGTPGPDAMLSPSRLDALRERMNKISTAAAVSEQAPSPVLSAATVRTDTSHMTGTMEALQQRMSLLRRKQEQL
ncbi:hypothetical protein WJX77_005628 [Trebouxia sp. C0004]